MSGTFLKENELRGRRMKSCISGTVFSAVFYFLLSPCASAVQVDIQVRADNNPDNDYIAWAPVEATARVIDPAGLNGDLPIMLADAGWPATDCSTTHHGAVLFSKTLGSGKTADQPTLNLVLPRSG